MKNAEEYFWGRINQENHSALKLLLCGKDPTFEISSHYNRSPKLWDKT